MCVCVCVCVCGLATEVASLMEMKRADYMARGISGESAEFKSWDFRYYAHKEMEAEYKVGVRPIHLWQFIRAHSCVLIAVFLCMCVCVCVSVNAISVSECVRVWCASCTKCDFLHIHVWLCVLSVYERVCMCVSEHVWMGGGGAVCHISPQKYSRPFVVRAVCIQSG